MMQTNEHTRLTPTERLHQVTMAALDRPAVTVEHSVTLARNARAVTQFEVVARGHDLAAVSQAAEAEFDRLDAKYPVPVTNGGE
jgi:hypothetical protein